MIVKHCSHVLSGDPDVALRIAVDEIRKTLYPGVEPSVHEARVLLPDEGSGWIVEITAHVRERA